MSFKASLKYKKRLETSFSCILCNITITEFKEAKTIFFEKQKLHFLTRRKMRNDEDTKSLLWKSLSFQPTSSEPMRFIYSRDANNNKIITKNWIVVTTLRYCCILCISQTFIKLVKRKTLQLHLYQPFNSLIQAALKCKLFLISCDMRTTHKMA